MLLPVADVVIPANNADLKLYLFCPTKSAIGLRSSINTDQGSVLMLFFFLRRLSLDGQRSRSIPLKLNDITMDSKRYNCWS